MTSIDPWSTGSPYETFMGRWSREIAVLFLDWLNPTTGLRWLDVGCGTGALSSLIGRRTHPKEVMGIDPSEAFIAYAGDAAQKISRLHFQVSGAENIPAPENYYDKVVSALALNFFPDPVGGLSEMKRVVKKGNEVAMYVWDYAEGMGMLRYFWDVVLALDSEARPLDEKIRFPICQPETLRDAFLEAGYKGIESRGLETQTTFVNFDDYRQPFLGGVGPAPGYVNSLSLDHRTALESALKKALPIKPDGTIQLLARAWAVKASA